MAEISDIRRNLALINSQNTPNEPETTATVTEMMDHFNAVCVYTFEGLFLYFDKYFVYFVAN